MKLLESLRESKMLKILFSTILLILSLMGLYCLIKRYNSPKNNIETYTNLTHSIFEPSGNTAHNLGSIFKTGELNLNAYPNVEIKPGQRLFQDNKFLPECCFYYSQYSSDRGCPCITPEQQYYLQRRGLNKDKNSFIQEKNDYKNLFFSPEMALKGEKSPFNENNIYFQRDVPPLSDISKNYVQSIQKKKER